MLKNNEERRGETLRSELTGNEKRQGGALRAENSQNDGGNMSNDMQAASFHWDIENNRLHWGPNVRDVLGVADDADLSSIGALMLFVDATHSNLRHEVVFDPANAERREYAITYRFLPEGRNGERGFMVVERGRWLVNAKGEPAHVFGEIMRADCVDTGACATPMLPDQVDPASGLHCRSYFMKRLEAFLKHGTQDNRNAALIILTLKNYSIIFDAYGFKAADAAFVEVGKRLKSVMRAGDILARYGDKRLAMLIHDCDEEDLGPAMARFLEAPCRAPVETDVGPVWPMLALGTTIIPRDARTLSEAIAFAEEALAEAEQQPGNTGRLYNIVSSSTSRRAMKAHFANEVFAALREKAFTLAYQPIVGAEEGQVLYHEALLHMINGHGETVSAGHLIPVAEELGLIRLVDLEVLDLALEALQGQPQGRLGINVSATTVMDADAFLERLMPHAELVRDRFIVEITESSMLSHPERVARFINELHKLGCKVALDDFGAGYTSFKNLRDYHFDIVKLDGAFCENLAANEQNQHFMRSLIELARNTNMEIIAEWVEREEDARLLREWGVHGLQGYLFGKAEYEEAPWPVLCRRKARKERPILPQKDRADEAPARQAAPDRPARGEPAGQDTLRHADDTSAQSAHEAMEPAPPEASEAKLIPEADEVAKEKETGHPEFVNFQDAPAAETGDMAEQTTEMTEGSHASAKAAEHARPAQDAPEEPDDATSAPTVRENARKTAPAKSLRDLMHALEAELSLLQDALLRMRDEKTVAETVAPAAGDVAIEENARKDPLAG